METVPVPLEVLQSIFVLCLDRLPLHPTRAPLLLMQICGEWRRVALATPKLWTALNIPVTDSDLIISALRSWLDSSQNRPLDFVVDFENSQRSITSSTQNSYVNVLCAHARRWREARFVLRYEQSTSSFAGHLTPEALPMLQGLSIQIGCPELGIEPDNSEQQSDSSLIPILNSCPFLRSLTLGERSELRLLSQLSSCSLQILRIDSRSGTGTFPFDASTLDRCLSQCPNLIALSINLPDADRIPTISDDEPHSPRFMPRVRTLGITTLTSEALAFVLNRIHVPHLERLYLNVVDSLDGSALTNGFHNLLNNCASSLKELTLLTNVFFEPHIIPSIVGLTNLTSLSLLDIALPFMLVDLFKALTLQFSPSGRLLSPQIISLHHISFELELQDPSSVRHYQEVEVFTAVVGMVLSRWKLPENATSVDGRPVQRLRSFKVGPQFVSHYKHSKSSMWKSVAQGWKDIEGLVQFDLIETHEDV